MEHLDKRVYSCVCYQFREHCPPSLHRSSVSPHAIGLGNRAWFHSFPDTYRRRENMHETDRGLQKCKHPTPETDLLKAQSQWVNWPKPSTGRSIVRIEVVSQSTHTTGIQKQTNIKTSTVVAIVDHGNVYCSGNGYKLRSLRPKFDSLFSYMQLRNAYKHEIRTTVKS